MRQGPGDVTRYFEGRTRSKGEERCVFSIRLPGLGHLVHARGPSLNPQRSTKCRSAEIVDHLARKLVIAAHLGVRTLGTPDAFQTKAARAALTDRPIFRGLRRFRRSRRMGRVR
jgi:hypothetical protein